MGNQRGGSFVSQGNSQADQVAKPGNSISGTWKSYGSVIVPSKLLTSPSIPHRNNKMLKNGAMRKKACACLVTSVVSDSLRPYGPWPARLLCPWDSPGTNTGVGCHSLLLQNGRWRTRERWSDTQTHQRWYCVSAVLIIATRKSGYEADPLQTRKGWWTKSRTKQTSVSTPSGR